MERRTKEEIRLVVCAIEGLPADFGLADSKERLLIKAEIHPAPIQNLALRVLALEAEIAALKAANSVKR